MQSPEELEIGVRLNVPYYQSTRAQDAEKAPRVSQFGAFASCFVGIEVRKQTIKNMVFHSFSELSNKGCRKGQGGITNVAMPSCFVGGGRRNKTFRMLQLFCLSFIFLLLLVLSFPSDFSFGLSSYSGKSFRQYLLLHNCFRSCSQRFQTTDSANRAVLTLPNFRYPLLFFV